ncbi:MAG: hypothetical protein ACI4J3_00070, partial [Oscillospiraceae bacterium]
LAKCSKSLQHGIDVGAVFVAVVFSIIKVSLKPFQRLAGSRDGVPCRTPRGEEGNQNRNNM